MRLLVCNYSPPRIPPAPPPRGSAWLSYPLITTTFSPKLNYRLEYPLIAQTISTTMLSLAVLLGIFCASPLDAMSQQLSGPREEANCREEKNDTGEKLPDALTNEEIVEEAWELVNESFLDTGRHRWSMDSWFKKKEDISAYSIQTRSKAYEIIRRMLASLGDPYTRFLSPAEFSKMARYDITGIGINLREIPDDNGEMKLKVLGLILDGPAHSAGVRQVIGSYSIAANASLFTRLIDPTGEGDELLSINGVDVKGKSAFEASSILQGPSNTSVNIMVKHGKCGPIESLNVERQSIAKPPVFYQLKQVKGGVGPVGYVRLKEFNALARKDLIIAMRRLEDMGASCFILDLRDNLGGLVQAGIEIAKLFLNKGETVTYTAGRDQLAVNNIVAETSPLFNAPVIVLVNKNTASASEIVATALHDNCRAVLVGERTYGKGLIQSVFELHDGSGVVVTVGKYVTPNHMDINGNGIDPDFHNLPTWDDVSQYLSQCHKPQEG